MNVTEKVLPNGLKVLLKEEHKAPVVTFQIWYKVGSRNERLGNDRHVAHAGAHDVQGNEEIRPQDSSRRSSSGTAGMTTPLRARIIPPISRTSPSDRIAISLDLESDRMQNLLLDPKEFLSERDVVKEERRMRTEDDPTNTMVEQMTAVAFIAHPYQWPVIGWMADISNITRDDLFKHYHRYYAPNNATIVVVGDFDTKTLLAADRKVLSARSPAGRPCRRSALLSPAASASAGSS